MSKKNDIFLVSMPFAGTSIPSIQLSVLHGFLRDKNIGVKTRHLFLKAADIYGLKYYNRLITNPNNSYDAQIAFSRYIFPGNWKIKKNNIKSYLENKNKKNGFDFSFDEYVEKTDAFFKWVIKSFEWEKFDYVGFSLNYGQLLPSLAVAKKIKKEHPEIKIVLGGSRCAGRLGVNLLKCFDFVDYVISGDGEKTLYELILNRNLEQNPGLIFRIKQRVFWNKNDNNVDLNNLPIPIFDSFYKELNKSKLNVKKYFFLNGRIPIEISRGCWWNRCTFCNLNLQHQKYREKNVKKIIDEIIFLSDRYKMINFQIMGNTLPKNNFKKLIKEIKKLNKDFCFFAEARAGRLKFEDYKLLKEAGFKNIQTGIESFSSNYLKKMNKGTRVIDNIAALKFSKEFNLDNGYNLITNFPNEEKKDFIETEKNTKFIKGFIDPPNHSPLIIGFGSPIFCQTERFNIKNLEFIKTDSLMFPKKILEKGICFYYKFEKEKNFGENNDWISYIGKWRETRNKFKREAIENKGDINELVFFMKDGKDFLKIYDKRDGKNVKFYILDKIERGILLSCIDIISFEKLKDKFSDVEDYKLAAILHTFEKNGLVFHENGYYFCLPLTSQKIKKYLFENEIEEAYELDCLI